ncbi:unnamed protein product [Leptidea sinapis]|uniref:Uncharacterized protein n=1 Tax=Leptidea sinapis TaxID=189913 RepID=A0A5E4QMW1_9NEOP|nr:unnamed protein product [Leptidea sinapis]
MMDISDEEETGKKCYKYPHKLTGNLNLVYNSANSMLCLWNRYQIFIHEGFNLKEATKTIFPEFQIKQTLISSNYLVCLDWDRNIQIISMKFKHSAQKRLKSSMRNIEQNILKIEQFGEDIIAVKYENNEYFLCLLKPNLDLQLPKIFKITHTTDIPRNIATKILFLVHALHNLQFNTVKEVFGRKDSNGKNYYVIIITFDRRTIFGCVFNPDHNEELKLLKLYQCQIEINDIKILNRNNPEIIIGLSTGTIIQLTLDVNRTCKIFHLNTCIEKFVEINDCLIYTDNKTLWRAENIFTDEVVFKEFFVKQVIDDDASYLKNNTEDVCSADNFLDNDGYVQSIMDEIEKMETLARKVTDEKNYITTLAIANRNDVMDNVLKYKVTVYDHFEDIVADDKTMFADDCKDIFDNSMFYLLVNITSTTLQQNFSEILSNYVGDFRIHITLFSDDSVLKTTSVKVPDQLKKLDLIVTLKTRSIDERIFLNLQLVTQIPGVLDEKQKIWACLHRKNIEIKSENFVRIKSARRCLYLKNKRPPFEDLIFKTVNGQYGTIFEFSSKPKGLQDDCTYFIKLPVNYVDVFKSIVTFKEHFHTKKAAHFLEQTCNDKFLKARSAVSFDVANVKLQTEILNDGFFPPVLKVSSRNIKIALDFRNFFSNLFHKHLVGSAREMVVKYSLYAATENIQKTIKECLEKGKDFKDFMKVHETFQRHIIGDLPI